MVYLTTLWLPILLSAVVVFVASSVMHMVLKYHRSDYQKLPNEDALLEALRGQRLAPGVYPFPCAPDPKDMKSPAMMEKYKQGPVGILTVVPVGPPAMGKYLVLWFVYCLVISLFAAYVAGRTLGMGTAYLAVFRIAGTVAFVGYAAGNLVDSIWKGQPWGTTVKHIFDGLIYALLTAGVFGWLWPR